MPRAGDGSEPVPAPRPGHVVGRCPICQRYLWIRRALLLRTAYPEPANAAPTSGTEPPSEGPLLEPFLSAASIRALELLRPPFPAELRRAADRIQQLALQQDPML